MSDSRLTVTVEEAGEILGISRSHAYSLVKTNEIPNIKLGRRIVVPRHGLNQLIEQLTEAKAS